MQDDLRGWARVAGFNNRIGRFPMQISSAIENREHGCKHKHRRNHQDQNTVAQSSIGLRAGRYRVVIAKCAALSEGWMRRKQHSGETNRCCR